MNEQWTRIIQPKGKWYDLKLREVWQYRDLIKLFVKRNFTTKYKQTVLGPLWLILSPLISTIISTFVFGTIAQIPSDGVPYFLFYMCGNTAWHYFSACFVSNASTFTANANVFGKVYFPRLTTPISVVITSLLNFGIQLVMFLGFLIYFNMNGAACRPNLAILLIPVLVVEMAILGMGCGIIVSSLTTKYRDLTVLVDFGVSLWLYITPVIYSIDSLPEKWANIALLNPMAPIVQTFRYAFLGVGSIPVIHLIISMVVTVVVCFVGILLFNRVERTFMDTV